MRLRVWQYKSKYFTGQDLWCLDKLYSRWTRRSLQYCNRLLTRRFATETVPSIMDVLRKEISKTKHGKGHG